MNDVRYFVFDIESVADGELVSSLKYPGEGLAADEAVSRYRSELMAERGSDFIPYTFQVPLAVAIAKVSADYRLLDIVSLDEPEFRPHVVAEHFWRGWERYQRPTFVTFNGRTFDIPLMELAAFRFGVSVPGWFNVEARSFEQARNRFNIDSHIDLQELLTNFGSSRFNGGLNLAANLLGKPGKMDVAGNMVQDLFNEGRLAEISDYCRCDVLDTYFVFLRTRVLIGKITLDEEQGLVAQAKEWLIGQSAESAACEKYLEQWGDWPDPRQASSAPPVAPADAPGA
jgi:predicted PolB exonuclease-like 3'-5' exonuclease